MPSASPSSATPHRKLWEEKNPWIAGVLAYLIPGAGHLYQGRILKGVIYSVSILGLFFWGQKLGQGMVVNNMLRGGNATSRYVALSYVAQLGAGAPALPAFLQNARAESPENQPVTRLSSAITADFQGTLSPSDDASDGLLEGTIRLEPIKGEFGLEVRGEFNGTLKGQPIKLSLGGSRFRLDRPVKAGFRRNLECDVIDENGDGNGVRRVLDGTIPRKFVDAYCSPPDPEQIQKLYEKLGTIYDLALVFTWIAGLLNVLAIWDCVCGPAYGFGDERTAEGDRSNPLNTSGSPPVPEVPSTNEGSAPEPPRAENRSAQKTPA
jgi:hypothetical protein